MSTIIFTHYGISDYLNTTLSFINVHNPNLNKIFVGDKKNRHLAIKYNWQWYDIDSICDELILEFEGVFKIVSGKKHKDFKNGRNWTKYVFLRWFAIRYILEENDIKNFWHFDSDTLVISNLKLLESYFENNLSMMQCNNMCLNGFIQSDIVNEYCQSIINQFKDNRLINKYEKEFMSNVYYAFTEMRAFLNYKENKDYKFISGMSIDPSFVFDDCLCQSHGYKTICLPEYRNVKEIYFNNGKCYFVKEDKHILAHTLNMSWLNSATINIILGNIKSHKKIFLSDSNFPLFQYALGLLRRIKGLF